MKINQVTLENFGIYKRKQFELGAAPLVLVYGPNESGKTTALNGLRQAVFGFRPRTPYLTGATMSAEVVATLQNGDALQFSRRKGRPDDLSGSLGARSLTPREIGSLLCDLDLDSYEDLFGFSQEELGRGQDALKSARLSEAFAGGSFSGISALERLRTELSDTLGELYKPRGSTSKINVKLSEIGTCRENLRSTETLPTVVEEMRSRLAELQRAGEQLQRDYEAAHKRRTQVQRLLTAMPDFKARAALQTQVDAIDFPPQIDSAFVSKWSDFERQRQELTTSLQAEQLAFDAEQRELQTLSEKGRIFEFEAEVEILGHQAEQMAVARRQLAELRQTQRDTQQVLAQLLESLQLDAITDAVADFSVSIPQRKELESSLQRFQTLRSERVAVRSKIEAAEDTLHSIENDELQFVPENLAELTEMARKLQAKESDLRQALAVLEQQEQNESFRNSEFELSQRVGLSGRLELAWGMPDETQVVDLVAQYDDLVSREKQAAVQTEQYQAELQAIEVRRKELRSTDAPRTVEQIEVLARQRDELIAQWLDELSQPLMAASISIAQQQERLHALKRLADARDSAIDELMEIADSVALQNQLRKQVEGVASKLEELREVAATAQNCRVEWQVTWNAIWAKLPFEPLSPKEMLVWSNDFKRWAVVARNLQQSKRESHVARGIVRTLREQLLDHWPTNLREGVSSQLLMDQVRAWELTQKQSLQAQERIRAAKQTLEQFAKKAERIDVEIKALQDRYKAWLSAVPISIDWPFEQVTVLIDALNRIKRESESLLSAETRITELESSLQDFNDRGKRLAEAMEQTFAEDELQVAARKWLATLHSERETHSRRIRLTTALEHRGSLMKGMQGKLKEVEEHLAALCASVDSKSRENVAALLDRARAAEVLRTEISQRTASINAHVHADQLESFLKVLGGTDEDALQLEYEELAKEVKDLEQRRKETDQSIGSLSQQMTQMAGGQESQKNLQELMNKRGELAELAEQWVLERLSRELLSRSIEKFSSENEPRLIKLTREYLNRMTGGRYVDVEHDKLEKGQFLVRNAKGEAYEPSRLSTGTREQLYLSIRMAFIAHHCEQHEPLPVVMDDCFVNFDDRRTRLAIESIADWDDSIQTILLSCHARVVGLVADIAPKTPVIDLDGDRMVTADEMVQIVSSI